LWKSKLARFVGGLDKKGNCSDNNDTKIMSISSRLHFIVVVLSALWCAAILGPPLLKHAGEKKLAEAGYSMFSKVCHQNEARSLHLEGEKFGVCARCTGVYFGFLLAAIIQLVVRTSRSKKARRQIFFISVAPMALDVLLNDIGILASTTASRLATGGFFGAAITWFVLPLFIEACLQIIDRSKTYPPPSGIHHYVRKAW
jgi:uncharacterized membrane protein